MKQLLIVITGLFFVASCATYDGAPDDFNKNASEIHNAVPRNEPLSRYGNPEFYTVNGQTYKVMDSSLGFVQKGEASWYGTKFHGRKTSSGEPYNMYAMTAAHKRLPLPTYVEVKNLKNGRKVIVKVNDRGPFHSGRIIDLSYAAAHKLGITGTGTAPVEIRAINTSALDLNAASAGATPITGDSGRIHVQVAAMSSEGAAEDVASELRDKHFNSVRVNVIESHGKKLYRVRIGPIPNVDLAHQVLKNLNDIGLNAAQVIID